MSICECLDDSETLKTPTTEMGLVLEILASSKIEISIIVSYFSKLKLSVTVCLIFVSNRSSIDRIIEFDMERTAVLCSGYCYLCKSTTRP